MDTNSRRLNLVFVLACLLALLLFLMDIAVPQAHLWGSFLVPIVVVFLWGRSRDIYFVTALASVLVAAEYWTEAPGELSDLLVYHLLPLAILWAAAWLLAQRQQAQKQLARNEEDLEQQVKARTAALAAREEQLARIFRANPGGIAVTRQSDGCFLEVNDAYLALVGYTRDQIIGHTLVDLGILSTESRAKVRAAFHAQGSLRGLDLQLTSAQGEPVDILYSLEQIEFNGEPCYLGLIVDVTERKRLETRAARLAAIVDASHEAIVSADLAGTIVSVNRGAEELYGVSAGEVIGRSVVDIALPQNTTGLQEALGRVGAGEVVTVDDAPWQLPDGTTKILSVSLSPIRDGGGEVIAFAALVHDISQRKADERALRASEARFATLFSSSPVGISLTRLADGRFQEVNAAYLAMVGWSREEIIGRSSLELGLISPDDWAHRTGVLQANGSLHGEELVLHTKGGEQLHTLLAVETVDFEGEPYLLSSIVDITDQKRYERLLKDTNNILEQRVAERTADLQSALAELQRAGKLKDEFMAMISHELRTPLTGFLSMSEILADQIAGPLNERQSFYVKGIIASGERLLNVVNGILSYTHLLSGKVQLRAEYCDLAYLLDICAASLERRAAAKNQSIAVQVTPPDLTITSDATALAEVLKRLLDNAVKFTPQGGRIGLEAHPSAVRGQAAGVDLVVWDTGVGIAADHLEHIVGPFTQVAAGLARDHEGLGLGLAYVNQMVRLLGGTLAIESALGVGSRFTITLPAQGD